MKHTTPFVLGILVVASAMFNGWCAVTKADTSPSNAPATQPTTAPSPVDLKDEEALKAAMGKMVAVEGIVTEANWGGGKVLRIQFEGGEKSHFLAVIFQKDRANFDLAYNGDVAKALVGKSVRVEGKLASYKAHPEIVITAASQLTVLK